MPPIVILYKIFLHVYDCIVYVQLAIVFMFCRAAVLIIVRLNYQSINQVEQIMFVEWSVCT